MEKIIEIILRISFIYFLIAFGYIIRNSIKDPENSLLISYLTKIILYIFFPFIVISSILNAQAESEYLIIISVVFGLIVIFSGLIMVRFYSNRKSIHNPTLGSMYLAVGFPNSVFLPFPLILLLIGPQGLVSATIFAVTIIIVQNSLGSYIGIKLGTNGSKLVSFLEMSKKIILFPPAFAMIIAILIKLLFKPDDFLDFFSPFPILNSNLNLVSGVIDIISWLSLILALILVGLTFDFGIKNKNLNFKQSHLISTAVFRLLVAPIFGIIFLIGMNMFFQNNISFSRIFIMPLIIQAFSGPAIINVAFAKQYRLDTNIESYYITIITIFSLIILPFLVLILNILLV